MAATTDIIADLTRRIAELEAENMQLKAALGRWKVPPLQSFGGEPTDAELKATRAQFDATAGRRG